MSIALSPRPRIEARTGVISGYASLYGVADNAGDIVEAGAFDACLKRKTPDAIRMLWQHDPHVPLGTWTRIVSDPRGLYVTGRLALATQAARDCAELIASGALDGLSIGFKTVRARKDRAGRRHLLEVDLWEVSVVTFPALPGARIDIPPPPLPALIAQGIAALTP